MKYRAWKVWHPMTSFCSGIVAATTEEMARDTVWEHGMRNGFEVPRSDYKIVRAPEKDGWACDKPIHVFLSEEEVECEVWNKEVIHGRALRIGGAR